MFVFAAAGRAACWSSARAASPARRWTRWRARARCWPRANAPTATRTGAAGASCAPATCVRVARRRHRARRRRAARCRVRLRRVPAHRRVPPVARAARRHRAGRQPLPRRSRCACGSPRTGARHAPVAADAAGASRRRRIARALARVADRIAGAFVLGLLLVALAVYALVARARPGARLRSHAGAAGDQLPLRTVAGDSGGARRRPRRAGAHRRAWPARRMRWRHWHASTDVVFDKTGTLSDGRGAAAQSVYGLRAADDECRALRAGRGAGARQPASARAARSRALQATLAGARALRQHAGQGIAGRVDGR